LKSDELKFTKLEVKLRDDEVEIAKAPLVPVAAVNVVVLCEEPTTLLVVDDKDIVPPVAEYVDESPLCNLISSGKCHLWLYEAPVWVHLKETMLPGDCVKKVFANPTIGKSAV
jgi:hypothetical protein